MVGSIPKTKCNLVKVPGSFDADAENRANGTHFSFSNGSLNEQDDLSSESFTYESFAQPLGFPSSDASSPPSKWFPPSPSSSCSSTPSLSEVDEESIEITQDRLENLFGINRAPWDMPSDDQKDRGEHNDQFFFFVPSPVNESSSQLQHSVFHSSIFDDDDDCVLKEDCWIEDDEDPIPIPFAEEVVDLQDEQPSKRAVVVAPESQQNHTTDRNYSRQTQFAFQTGLETIDEGKEDGDFDDPEFSFSCCSDRDETLRTLSMPESDDAKRLPDSASKTYALDTPPITGNATTALDDRGTVLSLTPEQQAAYECLRALAFFL